nr:hypothetical protein MACL_00000047 [Theileria orientalis]
MFRKRIPLNKREVSHELPESLESSSFSENLPPKDSINDNSSSNSQESHGFSVSDPNVSFRRGLRDGTITNKVDLSQDSSFKHTKKTISNLSFTDSLIENDLDKIQLRSSNLKRSFQKKRSRKGLNLTNTKKSIIYGHENATKPRISPEPAQSDTKFEEEVMEDVEFPDKLSEVSGYSDHESDDMDYGKDAPQTVQKDDGEVALYEISDVEEEFDIESEISQIIKNVEDELHILNKNLGSTNALLQQNTEKIAKLDTDQLELANRINSYFNLLEASRTLFSLVESKLPDLSRCLDKTRTNMIEETECLLRMRRWIYCDLLRLSGVNDVDYSCGELEDIDDMGKDLSITIGRTFLKRVESLQHFKQDLVKNSLKYSNKFTFKELEPYLVPEVRYLFTLKLGFNYTIEQLSELYEYEINLERVNINWMDDVTDEYKSISRSLEVFRTLKRDSDLLESFNFANLKDVFLFYVKASMLTWNPLNNPHVEDFEWFRVLMEFDPQLLPVIADEVLYSLALNCIEYFDIESYDQCNNLSQFLKFVLQNSGGANRSLIVEKITSSLHKSLQTKVSIVTFGVNSQDSSEKLSNMLDPVVCHILKFGYLNLVANVVCFSDFLSNATLATIAVDDLFLNKMLPLLDFNSALDAFLVLHFKRATEPLGRHLQIKTKNNSTVRLTFSRFSESVTTSPSNSDVFNSLSVPMDSDTYTRLIGSDSA